MLELSVPATESEINTTPNAFAFHKALNARLYLTGKVFPGRMWTERL